MLLLPPKQVWSLETYHCLKSRLERLIIHKIIYCYVLTFSTAEIDTESEKSPEQIRIKTLEEIRQEKAAKSQSQSQNDGSSVIATEITKTLSTKATKAVKRAITVKNDSIGHVKTFPDVFQTNKKRRMEQNSSPKKVEQAVNKAPCKSQGESNTAGPGSEAAEVGEVRVKTLEEIRKEKAVRMQAQEAENKKSSETLENDAKKPHILRNNKLASQSKTALLYLLSYVYLHMVHV